MTLSYSKSSSTITLNQKGIFLHDSVYKEDAGASWLSLKALHAKHLVFVPELLLMNIAFYE
jgi:hypothetical protein